ncbi:MAG: DUF732 domain-containing protein [Myxacorys chilensis ATA2-1-KO14]|jgi:hypothetical protein|nr:DUF732 domain-containing protein [Myxacorys chilensis ATA2-1-KO14]
MKKLLAVSALLSVLAPSVALAKPMSQIDKLFISDYHSLIANISDVNVRQILKSSAQRHPEHSIEQAKAVCKLLQVGGSMDEVRQVEMENLPSSDDEPDLYNAGVEDSAIVNTLALEHFCPQFKGRE